MAIENLISLELSADEQKKLDEALTAIEQVNTYESGTSFAAPHVAGAIALLMQCFPQLTAVQVKEILQKTAAPIPNGTLTLEDRKYWGAGKLNILAAYKSMAGFSYEKPYAYDENKYKSAYLVNSGSGLPFGPVNYNWTSINFSYQKYTNGAIFSDNRETNAYWLGEGIWKKWIALDSINSLIGLPVSSEFIDATNNNYSTVKFQKGKIFWNGSEAIISYYLLPTLSTTNVDGITKASANSGGFISSDGGASITSRGICWNSTGNPTILDSHTADGNGIGNFTSTMTNLIANTTYYVRAYATNSVGTVYGTQINFTTLSAVTTVTDFDGNVYHTVTIGTQTWLVENLKTTRYRNGDLIGTTTPATKDISNETAPKYQWAFNGDENYVANYGRLYTWYAVNDSRGISPIGWHVAADTEWGTLQNYLITNGYNYDGTTTGNNIAKSLAACILWSSSTYTGSIGKDLTKNNSTGFSALPGGYRFNTTGFGYIGMYGQWWSSTENYTGTALDWGMSYNSGRFDKEDTRSKSYGFSVRCVKDNSSVIPSLKTLNPSLITSTSIDIGGEVISNGESIVTACGVCWNLV